MKRFLTLVRMQGYMMLRNRQSIFWVLLFPVGMMLFWGYIGRGGSVQGTFGAGAQMAYVGYLMGGMIVMAALQQGVMGSAMGMVNLRSLGVLRRVRCTPLSVWVFLVSRLTVEATLTFVTSLLVVVIAMAVFGVRLSLATLPAALGVLILGIALFTAIGQTIAALAPKAETARAMAQMITLPLLFIGGIFLQPDLFPKPLAMVAQWTPAAVMSDILRPALVQGNLGGRPAIDLLVLVGYLMVALALAGRFFRWDEA